MVESNELAGKTFRPFGLPDGRVAYVYELKDGVVYFGWTKERGWQVFTCTLTTFLRDWVESNEA